jgi:SAM-dependent methyltransferase
MSNIDPCALCEGRLFTPIGEKRGFQMASCQTCGLVMVNPLPTEETLQGFYSANCWREWEPNTRWRKRWGNRARALWLRTLCGGGRLLDLGCGQGDLVAAAQGLRLFEAVGVDRTPDRVEYAQKRGLEVHLGTLESCGFEAESFDVVVMWHVLEHIPTPRNLLEQVRRVLRPGGHFVVATPNLAHRRVGPLGPECSFLKPPGHLLYFTPRRSRPC